MRFRADSVIRNVGGSTLAPTTTPAQKEEICQGCEMLRDSKCYSVKCGCPTSSNRVNPWWNLARCGEGKWTR